MEALTRSINILTIVIIGATLIGGALTAYGIFGG